MKIKPTVRKSLKSDIDIPDGFILIIDTREQDCLFKRPPKGLLIVRDTLSSGDYSVKGFEAEVAIERKGLSDFYGSIGNGRDRFKRELERLKGYTWAALVIEATEDEVLSAGTFYTSLRPNQIAGTLVSISIRYRLPIYYAKNRDSAERYTLRHLVKYHELKRRGEI